MIEAANRHEFDATKDWRRRFYKAIGKKEDAEFARRPELTFWMACCAMNYDEGMGVALFEKAYLQAMHESEKEKMGKPEGQEEREVRNKLEGNTLEADERS